MSMLLLYMYEVISLILSEDPVSMPFVFMNKIRVCKGEVDVMCMPYGPVCGVV